jgi:hypothetical protein
MSNYPVCLLLPLLRGPLPVAYAHEWAVFPAGKAGPVRLWPGLPHAPVSGWYCPEDWPFTPGQALACLSDMQQMGQAALSGLCVGSFAAGNNARLSRQESEAAARDALNASLGDMDAVHAAASAREALIARQQAQKILLWAWQQEERLADLSGLLADFTEQETRLAAVLAGEEGDSSMPESAAESSPEDAGALGLQVDRDLLPSWRLVLSSALHFVPDGTLIAAEGDMAEELLDVLDFSPAAHRQEILGELQPDCAGSLLEARAPAWKVLGRSRPTAQSVLDAERVWLVWRGA